MISIKDLETISNDDVFFAKIHPDAIIPTKREEDAGRDVYACFDEDYMVIPQHTTKLIPTGIASAMSSKYEIRLRDRGSNGSKGIHVNAGTIDSGFRSEIFVAWCNTNNKPVILSKIPLDELLEKYGVSDPFGTYIPENLSKDIQFNDSGFMCDNGVPIDDGTLKREPIFYPYTKAIAQAEFCEVPKVQTYEIPYSELKEIPSLRGTGSLGSSGK